MLMAVEMWMKRDHEAEWKRWTSWLETVAKRVTAVNGVTTSVVQPIGLSNRMPSLRVLWDKKAFGVTGEALVKTLWDTDPRIGMFPARGEKDPAQTGVQVNPYMMAAGDEKVVADRLYAILSEAAGKAAETPAPAAAAGDVSGQWNVRIDYAAGNSTHALSLRQRGNEIDGSHKGDFVTRDVTGTIDGDNVRLRSAYSEGGDGLNYTFTGKVSGDEMSGALDLGEYLSARWTATRRGTRRG